MTRPVPTVILATADFHADVWTNKQHLAVRLAATREVYYVESFGLRRPTLGVADLRRVVRRIGRRRPPETHDDRPASLHVISPILLPFHGSRIVRAVNAVLVRRSVQRRLPARYVLWSFSPLTYGLDRRAAVTVYHSVDLIHTQPHMPTETLLAAERRLVRSADVVIASSSGVQRHLVELGRPDTKLWENVADIDVFGRAEAGTRAPRAVFAGHLTPTKIDVALLVAVADLGVDLLICGPISRDGTRSGPDLDALLKHPSVTYAGNLQPDALAAAFARSRVGLIPYLLNDYTAGVFPLKVYEYLAAGLAVVSTPLPSLASTPEEAVLRRDPAQFAAETARQVGAFDEQQGRDRRDLAATHSWSARTRQAEKLLDELAEHARG